MHIVTITEDEVRKIAKLANLKLIDNEVGLFANQFTKTIEVVNELNEIDTSNTQSTYQVNGLSNVTREDMVDTTRILPRETVLSEAEKTHNGYFIVERLIDSDVEELT